MILAESSSGFAWGDAATWALAVLALFALLSNLRLLSQDRKLFTTLNNAWLDIEGEPEITKRETGRGLITLKIKNYGNLIATSIEIGERFAAIRHNERGINVESKIYKNYLNQIVPNASKEISFWIEHKKAASEKEQEGAVFSVQNEFKTGEVWIDFGIALMYSDGSAKNKKSVVLTKVLYYTLRSSFV